MTNTLEQMQREINQLQRRLEAFQSGGYATLQWDYSTVYSSSDWSLDTFSTTAKTIIDLSAVFTDVATGTIGVPAGIKAALFFVACRDAASAGGDYYIILSPNSTAASGFAVNTDAAVNDRVARGCLVVPCDANGDVYYQIAASGAGTFDVTLQIWGVAL